MVGNCKRSEVNEVKMKIIRQMHSGTDEAKRKWSDFVLHFVSPGWGESLTTLTYRTAAVMRIFPLPFNYWRSVAH